MLMSSTASLWAQGVDRVCLSVEEARGVARRQADMATLVLQQDSVIAAQQQALRMAWTAVDQANEALRLGDMEREALRQQLQQQARADRRAARRQALRGFGAGWVAGMLTPRPAPLR